MAVTPLTFPEFVDTTDSEQRWQIFNSIYGGVEISNDIGNPIPVVAVAGTTTESSYYHASSTASTNATLVATGSRSISFLSVFHNGNGNTNAYFKLYNKATAPTASDIPIMTLVIHPASTVVITPSVAIYLNLGIGYRMTANYADNDNTAVTANELAVNIAYL